MRRTLEAADEANVPFLASALTFDALLAAVPFVLLLLVGLTLLAQIITGAETMSAEVLFHRFLPPHASGPKDPFAAVEGLLGVILRNRSQLSLVAVPTFLWFSTRLFGGIRTSLGFVYDVGARPMRRPKGIWGIVFVFARNKLRDLIMTLVVVVLFLANTAMSAGLAVLNARGQAWAELRGWGFFAGEAGRYLTEVVTIAFSVLLFALVYQYASPRRMSRTAGFIAGLVAAFGFEIAKRLYGLYLRNAVPTAAEFGGASLGAIVLFVLWLYYMGVVFLIGGVVAETWELRALQRRQRLILA